MRPPRLEVPDGYFHVHTRGNDRQQISFGGWSFELFVFELDRVAARFRWRVLAYCLMDNHYHVVLQIRDHLSAGMRDLNGNFARATNKRLGRTNHLFGRRFSAWPIDDESYLLEVVRYVLLNPVRARRVIDPLLWPAGSLRAMKGQSKAPACLDIDGLLAHFDASPIRAAQMFDRFLTAGVGLPRPEKPVPGTDFRGAA